MRSTPPVILSIAGSDCSSGAGLQADLKAGFELGCYPLTAVTCVVSEVPGLVEDIVAMEPSFVAAQVRLLLRSFPVAAIKTGMLYSPEIVSAVCRELDNYQGPIVVDPVMIATAGESLMQQAAIAVYEQELLPRTTILTPNKDELEILHGGVSISTTHELTEAAKALATRYNCAILAKGGHVGHDTCTDVLVQPDGHTLSWSHPRVQNISTHGTGCTLSSALAAELALGLPMEEAVPAALDYIAGAIASSHKLGELYALDHHAGK